MGLARNELKQQPPDELRQLREENARLKALLISHGVAWEDVPSAPYRCRRRYSISMMNAGAYFPGRPGIGSSLVGPQTLPDTDLFVFMYVRKEAVLSSQNYYERKAWLRGNGAALDI
jgi:hypothetical protein